MTRFHKGVKPFYEVYFFKFHLIKEQISFWIRFTLHNPLKEPSHGTLWAMMFDQNNPKNNCGGIKNFSLKEIKIEKDIFYLQLGKSALFQNGSYGSLKDKDFEIDFNSEQFKKTIPVRKHQLSHRIRRFVTCNFHSG